MRSKLLLLLFCCWLAPIGLAANIEGGFHVGYSVVGAHTILGTEKDGQWGVWAIAWPHSRVALSADWAYVPQKDFFFSRDGLPLGERERNRQYVDTTIQYHFPAGTRSTVFVQAGGGAFWNNRQVANPNGHPGFTPQGPEHTRFGMWTLGGGFRTRLAPHLHWITELKLHNPTCEAKNGVRAITGLTVSLR